jgi:ABC-type uncharacterized transport system substrate-binding protein
MADAITDRLRSFRQGLKDTGHVEGESVTIAYRFAENQTDHLPALAAELVRRQVGVIVTSGGVPSTLAAKAATTTIPVVLSCSAANDHACIARKIHRGTNRLHQV